MTDTRTHDASVRTLPLAAGGDLELKLGSNRLRIRTTDGDHVVIRGRTDHDLERDVEITTGEGWIRVTDGPAGSFRVGPITVRSGGHTPDLDVEVPRNVRISARTLSGDIEAVGIAGPSRWQSASGDVRLGVDGGPVVIETMSGDALIDAHGPLAVTARTVSGTVKVRAPRITVLDTATTSGDVTIDAVLDAASTHSITSVSGDVRLFTGSEVTVELQSVTGDIKASLPHRADGARGRRTIVVGSGRVKVGVKTMSGDVKIKPGAQDTAPNGIGGDAGAPKASFWAEFSRDWAESAKDWASWGTSLATGKAWGSTWAASQPEPPTPPVAPDPPSPPAAPVPPPPPAAPEPPFPAPAASDAPVEPAQPRTATSDAPVEPAQPISATEPTLDDTAPVPLTTHADLEAARLEVLRALERGDVDVATAADRLAALETVPAHEES